MTSARPDSAPEGRAREDLARERVASSGAAAEPRALLGIRSDERGSVLLAAFTFFCLLASYFVLKPLRDEIGLKRGSENLAWLWTGTLALTLVLTPLFAWLVSRFPRRTFLPVTYRFFALNLIAFALLGKVLQGAPREWLAFAFYFWVSVFNMLAVSVFWAAMADAFRLEQSRRLFGYVAVGGTLGAIAGAAFTKAQVDRLGSFGLMLCSVVLLEVVAQCLRLLVRRVEPNTDPASTSIRGTQRLGTAWSGMERVARSPYLRAIGLSILLQTLTAAFLELALNRLIEASHASGSDRTRAFADRDLWTQIATLALQLLVTGQLLRRIGVSATLAIQPFLTIAGFALLAWTLPDELASGSSAPGGGFPADIARLDFALWTAILFQAVVKATQNAFSRPARETLFTVVDREEKYKSKSFLDTFVLRGGDFLFGWVARGVSFALPAPLVAGAVIPFAGVWVTVNWMLGRKQSERARGRPGA